MAYKDPEKQKAYAKAYRESNRLKAAEYGREYVATHKDCPIYKERNKLASTKYKKANKGKVSLQHKKWREANKNTVAEIRSRFRENRPNYDSDYYKENVEKVKERLKRNANRHCVELSDYYIKASLKRTGFPKELITSELIELKRITIKTERLCRQLKS